jgi:hypothetical protein
VTPVEMEVVRWGAVVRRVAVLESLADNLESPYGSEAL